MVIEVFKDISALPSFRRQRLISDLQTISSRIRTVTAEYVHFAQLKTSLSAVERKQLRAILTYGDAFTGERKGAYFLVVPRPGTISPWSSKATDIARNCGLGMIHRIERGIVFYVDGAEEAERQHIAALLHDRMTEVVLDDEDDAKQLFATAEPQPLRTVDVLSGGKAALESANQAFGLALADDEIEYLADAYTQLNRNPTDAELMMFGQVNSEHCRHKVFNADWTIDGKKQPKSLFKMIKNTYEHGGEDVLSAYSDNAAVLRGPITNRFFADAEDHVYRSHEEAAHLVIKVETHNHPTAIAPFPGAATGSGGEIRDEGATGCGAKPKMGLTGFSVSNLFIPDFIQPWETKLNKPARIVSALDIMVEGPLGGAAFNNEFGRPNLTGYFRTYEQRVKDEVKGYHKPIMIAGGLGTIRDEHVQKGQLPVGAKLIVLGGPSMLIGLGGGAASSMQTGTSEENLDFASVQRANAEIERRAQEVINTCWSLGEKNPIMSIHDVGAGGLSNALPELVHDAGLGARFELRAIPNDEPGMSPMEIWCNESQERYVLGISPDDIARFTEFCERERCPFAIVGETTAEEQLIVHDAHFNNNVVDLPMSVLFGKPPKMSKDVSRHPLKPSQLDLSAVTLEDAVSRVLRLPSVASKKFLITIGDRSVGGLTVRDQMVGKWQVPVSDVAVTASSFGSKTGEAMAMGERTPLALIDSAAAARMAIAETVTNMAAARIEKIADIKLSANWMAAVGHGDEDGRLYDAVKAVGEEFCPELGLTIPVGKDSLSMRTVWDEESVVSPVSLIISGFAPVAEVTQTLTPEIHPEQNTALLLIDLGKNKNRLGGSALAQVYNQLGDESPDVDAEALKALFMLIQRLNENEKILAYHDRSDGGVFTTLCEMSFAARCGLAIDLPDGDPLALLFSEEIGVVIEVLEKNVTTVMQQVVDELGECVSVIARPLKEEMITVQQGDNSLYQATRADLESIWAETSYRIQKLRDNPDCADEEYKAIADVHNQGLHAKVVAAAPRKKYANRPKVAIFREQGVNGQVEMAAAFDRAGFEAVDVHLEDIIRRPDLLKDFAGLAACGGFSYGDVLGAGEGWAKSILFNPTLRNSFSTFFTRPETFTLGVCNGCQMLSNLREIIPGADHWPKFMTNKSQRFEARTVMVSVNESPSVLLKGMAGSLLPIVVAHGEGRALFSAQAAKRTFDDGLVPMHYAAADGARTEAYPANPNGSPLGLAAVTSQDGRATIMMPHPERSFMTYQNSWHPDDWAEEGPWFQLFLNARKWVG